MNESGPYQALIFSIFNIFSISKISRISNISAPLCGARGGNPTPTTVGKRGPAPRGFKEKRRGSRGVPRLFSMEIQKYIGNPGNPVWPAWLEWVASAWCAPPRGLHREGQRRGGGGQVPPGACKSPGFSGFPIFPFFPYFHYFQYFQYFQYFEYFQYFQYSQ